MSKPTWYKDLNVNSEDDAIGHHSDAYSDQEDPCEWGYLFYDSFPLSNILGFRWFNTKEDLCSYILQVEVWLDSKLNESEEKVEFTQNKLIEQSTLFIENQLSPQEFKTLVNKELHNHHLEWLGRYSELLNAEDSKSKSILEEFNNLSNDDDEEEDMDEIDF